MVKKRTPHIHIEWFGFWVEKKSFIALFRIYFSIWPKKKKLYDGNPIELQHETKHNNNRATENRASQSTMVNLM